MGCSGQSTCHCVLYPSELDSLTCVLPSVRLQAKQADLAEVMERLGSLERQLEKSVAEKSRLEGTAWIMEDVVKVEYPSCLLHALHSICYKAFAFRAFLLSRSPARILAAAAETELCTAKLERAEKLISGLGGEKTRWTEAAARMAGQYDCLTGDMLIAAGEIFTYNGEVPMGFPVHMMPSHIMRAS